MRKMKKFKITPISMSMVTGPLFWWIRFMNIVKIPWSRLFVFQTALKFSCKRTEVSIFVLI